MLLTLFEGRREAERRLKAQVKPVRVSGARAIFVPGNHDWGSPGLDGCEAGARGTSVYIDDMRKSVDDVDVSDPAARRLSGPTELWISVIAVVVIVLDTEWWLDGGSKASPEHPGALRQRDRDRACRPALER
mgnify:CR=1 FL=1